MQKPLAEINQTECHHIFPRKILREASVPNEKIDSLCNICLYKSKNNKIVKDQNPSEYLKKCYTELGVDAEKVFQSTLIPKF